MPASRNIHNSKDGSALLVALGTLAILMLLVSSFAFEAKLETLLISQKRKRFEAEMLAHSGIEYARAILDKQSKINQLDVEEMPEDKDGFMKAALYIKRGLSTTSKIKLGRGLFRITLESAEGGRNINILTREEWLDILEMANVPSTEWDTMIDCLKDWIDEGDLHELNGAESDDPFYEKAGYKVKNGQLDSVEELLLIKGWGADILYGKPADNESDAIFGIAKLLTVWGDGKVNINTAQNDVLLSFSSYDEWQIANIIESRWGDDGESNTLDDGIRNLSTIEANESKFKLQSDFVKVTSIGEIFGKKYKIMSIFLLKSNSAVPVYWREGLVK